MYHIACFLPSNDNPKEEVEIVHDAWLSRNKKSCFYPPFLSGQIKKALETGMLPDSSWKQYKIRILQSYDSYKKAQEILSLAEITSDLEMDSEDSQDARTSPKNKKLRRVKRKQSHNYSSDSEPDEPVKPKKQKESDLIPTVVSVCSLSSPITISESSLPADQPVSLSSVIKNESHSSPDHSSSESNQQIDQQQTKERDNLQQDIPSVALSPFENRVLQWMEEINEKLKENASTLSNILLQLNEKRTTEIDDCLSNLPLKSLENMKEFEGFLESSENFKKALCYLSAKGGNSISYAIRHTMNSVMTLELASKFNWAGRGNKESFKETRTQKLVILAVRENKVCQNVEEKEIAEGIKSYLKFAPLKLKHKR